MVGQPRRRQNRTFLDIFDIADPADPEHLLAARDLMETATRQVIGSGAERPGYIRYVPPDWRDNEASRPKVEALIDIAEQTGARVFVERLRFEWRDGTPIAPPSGRLDFRQPHDDDEILDLMTAVVPGSLDAHTVLDLQTMTPGKPPTSISPVNSPNRSAPATTGVSQPTTAAPQSAS